MQQPSALTPGELRRIAGQNRQARQLVNLQMFTIEQLQAIHDGAEEDTDTQKKIGELIDYLTSEPPMH